MGLAKIFGFNKEPELPTFMTDGSLIDVENYSAGKTEVKVNGKKTELTVGNVFICPKNDTPFLVTIGGIMVSAGGKVSYLCEWNDPYDGSAKQDIMTVDEIQRFVRRNSL